MRLHRLAFRDPRSIPAILVSVLLGGLCAGKPAMADSFSTWPSGQFGSDRRYYVELEAGEYKRNCVSESTAEDPFDDAAAGESVDAFKGTVAAPSGGVYQWQPSSWDWRTTPARVIRVVFYQAPQLSEVQEALRELNLPVAKIVPASNSEKIAATDLASLEQQMRTLENTATLMPTNLFSKVILNGELAELQVKGQLPQVEVHLRTAKIPALIPLYDQALTVEKDPLKKEFYRGAKALFQDRPDEAFTHFETIGTSERCTIELCERVTDCYRLARGNFLSSRYLWLTRLGKLSTSWRQCKDAFRERDQLSSPQPVVPPKYYGVNVSWAASRMPLKVCFIGADKEGYDNRLIYQFRQAIADWSTASGNKIDFIVVGKVDGADIVCEWEVPDSDAEREIQKRAKGRPESGNVRGTLGTTSVGTSDKFETHAHIRIIAHDSKAVSDKHLRAIVLHETGHALGIRKHIEQDTHCAMFPSLDLNNFNVELSKRDIQVISELYKTHPVNAGAVAKFVGLPALCDRR